LHSLHRIQDDNYGNGFGSSKIEFKVKDMEMELVQQKKKTGGGPKKGQMVSKRQDERGRKVGEIRQLSR
jgi:hypothetical protein